MTFREKFWESSWIAENVCPQSVLNFLEVSRGGLPR